MPATFLVSDTHFGHTGVCRFTRTDGVTPLRPWTDPDQMDDDMVRAWNDRVRPNDKVYHLGDVVINRKALPTLARLGCGPLPEKRKRKNFQDAHAKGNPDIDNAVVKKYN